MKILLGDGVLHPYKAGTTTRFSFVPCSYGFPTGGFL